MLNKEQIEQVKKQLLSQLENLPESQRETLKEQIEEMSDKELEDFLIKNKLIRAESEGNEENSKGSNIPCTFCLLVDGSLPSNKIAETKEAIAILEINPISKGHSIIIPKEHISSKDLHHQEKQEISKSLEKFAKALSIVMKEKLNANKIEIIPSELFGHVIINLIPIYEDKALDLDAKRHKASEDELVKLKELLQVKEFKGEERAEEEKINDKKEPGPSKTKGKKEKKLSKKQKEKLEREEIAKLPKYPKRIP